MDELIERLVSVRDKFGMAYEDARTMEDAITALRAVRDVPDGFKLDPADRITELEAEVARLRKDAARLDWLDANAFTAYRQIDPLDGLSDHCVVVHETQKPRRGNVAATARAAIDAARKEAG